MTFAASVRDTVLVARFELLRAIRTWGALALVTLYLIANVGMALLFIGLVSILEEELSRALGVPATRWPGALTAQLLEEGGALRQIVGSLSGDPQSVEGLLRWPVLAIFQLWAGLRLTPLLAAMTAAESISVDVHSRAIRFEAQRTGRLELAMGRFFGQVLLAGLAVLLSGVGVWIAGMTLMVGNSPIGLGIALAEVSVRIWIFSLPFLGIGLAVSQWTASSAWARVLAVFVTVGLWVGYLAADYYAADVPIVLDLVLQILPFDWRTLLFSTGWGFVPTAVAALAWGIAAVGVGYLRFRRRDL